MNENKENRIKLANNCGKGDLGLQQDIIASQCDTIKTLRRENKILKESELAKTNIIDKITGQLLCIYDYIDWQSTPNDPANPYGRVHLMVEIKNILSMLELMGFDVNIPKAKIIPPIARREMCPMRDNGNSKCVGVECAWWRNDSNSCGAWASPDVIDEIIELAKEIKEIARRG